jgi:hypothetical protein
LLIEGEDALEDFERKDGDEGVIRRRMSDF